MQPWDKPTKISFLRGECADFEAWQSEGSVPARLLEAPGLHAPNRGGHAAPGAGRR